MCQPSPRPWERELFIRIGKVEPALAPIPELECMYIMETFGSLLTKTEGSCTKVNRSTCENDHRYINLASGLVEAAWGGCLGRLPGFLKVISVHPLTAAEKVAPAKGNHNQKANHFAAFQATLCPCAP